MRNLNEKGVLDNPNGRLERNHIKSNRYIDKITKVSRAERKVISTRSRTSTTRS